MLPSEDRHCQLHLSAPRLCLTAPATAVRPPAPLERKSGGTDSVNQADLFGSVLRPQDPDIIKAWILPNGSILCVDLRFTDWLGKAPADCTGKMLVELGAEDAVKSGAPGSAAGGGGANKVNRAAALLSFGTVLGSSICWLYCGWQRGDCTAGWQVGSGAPGSTGAVN